MVRVGDGTQWARDDKGPTVTAPLTNVTMDIASNWSSPFENAGVESKAPAIAQMAQAGLFAGVMNALGAKIPADFVKTKEFVGDIENSAKQLMGRSGVTVLNSTQVWTGQAPIKLQLTLFFRAFKDPNIEVEQPLRQLQEWAMPKRLAPDGIIASTIKNGADLLTLMPSEVPTVIGFFYKRRIFNAMCIEAISDDLSAPVDKNGYRISSVVNMTICSLTALDVRAWDKTYQSDLMQATGVKSW